VSTISAPPRYATAAQRNYLTDDTEPGHARLLTGRRSPTPGVPDDVAGIVVALTHPNRLPLLIALEDRPRTLQELVHDLQMEPEPVKYALKQLRAAGLIEVFDTRSTIHNLVGFVYGTPLTGWSQILDAVTAVAATADPWSQSPGE
jgi:hypothetical protein